MKKLLVLVAVGAVTLGLTVTPTRAGESIDSFDQAVQTIVTEHDAVTAARDSAQAALASSQAALAAVTSERAAVAQENVVLEQRIAELEAALAACAAPGPTPTPTPTPDPTPDPTPTPQVRSPEGVWAIRQVTSVSALTSATGEINKALRTDGVVGFGLRIPVSLLIPAQGVFDSTILDRGLAIARAEGRLFKPRVIWGRYTPTWAMGPKFSDANGSGPMPFLTGGAPNTAFENAYRFVLQNEVAWASPHQDAVMLDSGWYSLNYSELYYGPGVQSAFGGSASSNTSYFIAAHKRLIDVAVEAVSGTDIPVGFGMSGHGPIGSIAPALASHMVGKSGVYLQANGWGPSGEWGGALESTLDAGVWPKPVARGLQDISPNSPRTASEWSSMFASAERLNATYVEIYTYQWTTGTMNANQGALDAMVNEISGF